MDFGSTHFIQSPTFLQNKVCVKGTRCYDMSLIPVTQSKGGEEKKKSALADVSSQVACGSVCAGGSSFLPCVTNILDACCCLRGHVSVVKLHARFIKPTAKLWEGSRDVKSEMSSVSDSCFLPLML